MSESHDKHDDDTKSVATDSQQQTTGASAQDALSQLMASGAAPSPAPKATPNLESEALRAAEQALAEGARALSEAEHALQETKSPTTQPPTKPVTSSSPAPLSRTRERVLRAMIGMNIVAMIVLVLLPSPNSGVTQPKGSHDAAPHANGTPSPAPQHDPVVKTPSLRDPVLRAFSLAESRDYKGAIALLEQHLADNPRLDAGKKANVLLALEHYASQIGDFAAAQEYQRRTDALRSSHSLPEDLVQMALEAERNGDIESMRRHYSRLLLQQRQIPSSLYRHVAEAYLKLGDSYRAEAEKGDAAARERELETVREQLRRKALESDAAPKSGGGGK